MDKKQSDYSPMNHGKTRWQDDFPMREEVEDFSGKTRVFMVDCHQGHLGFTVRAREEGVEAGGYEFGAYSETSPYSALGQFRVKMRRALATRHISGAAGNYQMLHDRIRGHIEWSQDRGVPLVVDGMPLAIKDLTKIFPRPASTSSASTTPSASILVRLAHTTAAPVGNPRPGAGSRNFGPGRP